VLKSRIGMPCGFTSRRILGSNVYGKRLNVVLTNSRRPEEGMLKFKLQLGEIECAMEVWWTVVQFSSVCRLCRRGAGLFRRSLPDESIAATIVRPTSLLAPSLIYRYVPTGKVKLILAGQECALSSSWFLRATNQLEHQNAYVVVEKSVSVRV
jgi:hypothetical protein